MIENKTSMDPKAKALAILFILLIIGTIIGIGISLVHLNSLENRVNEWIEGQKGEARPWVVGQIQQNWQRFSEMYTLVTVIICMNLALLCGLLYVYTQSFRQTKSSFSLGLILFLGVLFVQSLISLPIIQTAFGQVITDLGLFHVLPNMFETIALIILFYLSSE